MKAAIPTSKLTHGLLHCCVEAIGSGSVFATKNIEVQQTQGLGAFVEHFNLLHIFFPVLLKNR